MPMGVLRDRGINFWTVGTIVEPSRLTLDVFTIPGELELSAGIALGMQSGDKRSEFFFTRLVYQQEHVAWLTWHAGVVLRSYDRLRESSDSPYRILNAPRGESREAFLPAYKDSVFVKSDSPGEDRWVNKDDLDSQWSMLAGVTLTPVYLPFKTLRWFRYLALRARAGIDVSGDLRRASWYSELTLSTKTKGTLTAWSAAALGVGFLAYAKGWFGVSDR